MDGGNFGGGFRAGPQPRSVTRTNVVQHYRTATANHPPEELLEGEIALEMADPMRLWIGVPTMIDPTGRRLLYDAAAGGGIPEPPNDGVIYGRRTMIGGGHSWNAVMPLSGGTMTGNLTLAHDPGSALHAATKQYTDTKLPLAGGSMTGPLLLAADPTAALGAATKQYVDDRVDGTLTGYLPLSGGVMSGPLVLAADPASAMQAVTKQYADAGFALLISYVRKSGDTMTGALTLAADPSSALQAATKQYADLKLALAGGTMTGALVLAADPAASLQAATKRYVDNSIGTVFVADAPPASPRPGSLWFDSVGLQLYVSYVDPNSTQWIPATNQGGVGNFLQLSGGTLTGPLIANGSPTAATFGGGVGFGGAAAASADNLARHISLHSAGFGFNVTTNRMNYVVPASNGHYLRIAGTDILSVSSTQVTSNVKLQSTSPILSVASGNAVVTCWSTGAGAAMGMWCGSTSLIFGNTDGSGVPTTARMTLDGSSNLIVGGTVYVSNAAVGNTSYLSSDGSFSVWNFQSNYALVFRKSDGALYYNSSAAPGNMAFQCSNTGNFSAPGSVQGVNIIGTNACFPSYSQSTDFYITGDATNLHLRWAGGWELYYQRSSGSMFYQRASTNWFNWRAADAVTYNGIANQGGIGPYADYSDVRGKRDIEDHEGGLDLVRALRPVSFTRIPRDKNLPPPRREIGFVAQELREVIPEAVMPFEDLDADEPGLAITTTAIIAALVNSVKQLEARLGALEGR